MILLRLKHMRPGVLTMEAVEIEERAFSTRKNAELWLEENGFFEGRRSWFNYRDDYRDWCHKDEMPWDYVEVEIEEYEMDKDDKSRFRDFHFELAPWHETLVKKTKSKIIVEMSRESGKTAEETIQILMTNFDFSQDDAQEYVNMYY